MRMHQEMVRNRMLDTFAYIKYEILTFVSNNFKETPSVVGIEASYSDTNFFDRIVILQLMPFYNLQCFRILYHHGNFFFKENNTSTLSKNW